MCFGGGVFELEGYSKIYFLEVCGRKLKRCGLNYIWMMYHG